MRVTIFKTMGERRIEGATWGLILVWVGVMMFVEEPKGVASLGAGSILLASALLQKVIGYEAGIVLWAAGLALSISGLNDVLGRTAHLSALGIILVVAGAFVVLKSLGASRRHHLRDVSHRRFGPRGPSGERPPDIDI